MEMASTTVIRRVRSFHEMLRRPGDALPFYRRALEGTPDPRARRAGVVVTGNGHVIPAWAQLGVLLLEQVKSSARSRGGAW
ncbi:hypothetical protein FDA94_30765 [Herbidospora galbida]|uniref:Tetratricopeptide repeat protein n=1 Tax=Herbidospora galbida TaxID=2575442 RepID=A0A4U3M7B7_9ACTN|nr:hypothetical protein [Herbidospora galbida]TKK84099.1 hypothetical protein FDA94_30765 [Herbidospora galbida]